MEGKVLDCGNDGREVVVHRRDVDRRCVIVDRLRIIRA